MLFSDQSPPLAVYIQSDFLALMITLCLKKIFTLMVPRSIDEEKDHGRFHRWISHR
jgi:hypothetical protein